MSLDGKPLDKGLVDLTKVASVNREMVFEEVLINGKPRADLPLTTLYVTQEEREAASQLTNIKKADLVKMAEDLVVKLTDDSLLEFFKEKLALVQKRLSSTKKEAIISIYEEISKLVENNELDQHKMNMNIYKMNSFKSYTCTLYLLLCLNFHMNVHMNFPLLVLSCKYTV